MLGAMSGPARRLLEVLLVLALAVPAAWLAPLDVLAEEQIEAGLKRALVTFAVARSLNAAMSVAQEVELHAQLGVGASISPGQLLSPLNDLVEQFSTVMLAVCASFAGQRVLIGVGAFWPISALLTVSLLAWGWWRWRHGAVPVWLARATILLLLVRFAVPLAALGSELTFQWVMEREYAGTQAQFEAGSREAEATVPSDVKPGESVSERLKRWWAQGADVGAGLQALRDKADALVEHIIRLLAVFLVQTMVLPLLLVWLLQRVFRVVVSGGDGAR